MKLPMTLTEVSQAFHVSPAVLEHWIQAGKLVAARDGAGTWVILPTDLQSFLHRYLVELLESRRDTDHDFQLLLEVMMTLCAIEGTRTAGTDRLVPNVLVIDDSPVMQKLGMKVLGPRGLGCHVEAVGNGYDACQSIVRSPVDLALIDLMMPQIDGLNLCRMLRSLEQTRDVAIIVISGVLTADVKERLSRYDIRHFLQKPFEVGELVQISTDALRQSGWDPQSFHGITGAGQ